MKRPEIVNFLAILNEEFLSIRASITMAQSKLDSTPLQSLQSLSPLNSLSALHALDALEELDPLNIEGKIFTPSFPIEAFRQLSSHHFVMKLWFNNGGPKEQFGRVFDSDAFGNFFFKIPRATIATLFDPKDLNAINVFETRTRRGLELNLGTFFPIKILGHKKIVICDFDKTLVDTRYSTTKEVYRSLTKPLSTFPTVTRSLQILKDAVAEGFHPFILSASPHFYEGAIRDWLYQNHVYTAGIFLKDYRQVFSLFDGDLSPKDLKKQGLYKLTHLLDILSMTGVPDELVLMGDNFESDPVIYLTLLQIILELNDPWAIWKNLGEFDAFTMSTKQNSLILNKIYQLSNAVKLKKKNQTNKELCEIKIYIRKSVDEQKLKIKDSLLPLKNYITLYNGNEASSLPRSATLT